METCKYGLGASTRKPPTARWVWRWVLSPHYTSDIQEIAIPDEAEILIGSARLEPAGVVVWKEKSDDRHK